MRLIYLYGEVGEELLSLTLLSHFILHDSPNQEMYSFRKNPGSFSCSPFRPANPSRFPRKTWAEEKINVLRGGDK